MANDNDNGNDKKPPEPQIEEPVYITPPHPETVVVSSEATVNPGEPIAAEKSMSDLIQEAVAGLRAELKEELESQVREIQADLQAELQTELKKGKEGGLELNDEITEFSVG